jgi:hypothetical protein
VLSNKEIHSILLRKWDYYSKYRITKGRKMTESEIVEEIWAEFHRVIVGLRRDNGQLQYGNGKIINFFKKKFDFFDFQPNFPDPRK